MEKKSNKLYLKEHVFFKFINNKLILWNYRTHDQFEITSSEFLVINKIVENQRLTSDEEAVVKDLLENNIISTEPEVTQPWGWDILSHIYHMGTMDINPNKKLDEQEFVREYLDYSEKNLKEFKFNNQVTEPVNKISLPKPNKSKLENLDFLDTLLKRKTTREFINYKYPLEYLSTLLYYTLGFEHPESKELAERKILQHTRRRLHPSAGNIHPEELYIYVFNVEGILPGVYYYCIQNHELLKVNENKISYDEFSYLVNNQPFGKNTSFALFLCSNLEKVWWKYKHSKSYKLLFHEIGGLSQNIQLVGTSLKASMWQTGEFRDSDIKKLLNLKNNVNCTFIICIGRGTGNVLPESFYNFIDNK